MNANRELDQMLAQLRQTPVAGDALEGVERRMWQLIEMRAAQAQRPKVQLAFLLASVTAAFVWGIFSGGEVTAVGVNAPALLVEEMDLLPADLGSLQP